MNVLDANDAPTGLTIDNDSIVENQPTKTVIGEAYAVDPDATDRHTYKIVGGKDMKRLLLRGDTLSSNDIFDYETEPLLEVVVRVTDSKKLYADVTLNINVTDVNDPPSDITIDRSSVPENQPENSKVGKLYLVDVDGGSDDGVGSGGGFNLKNGLLVHYPLGDATDESGDKIMEPLKTSHSLTMGSRKSRSPSRAMWMVAVGIMSFCPCRTFRGWMPSRSPSGLRTKVRFPPWRIHMKRFSHSGAIR